MDENPCFRPTKLKEPPGRDRVLSDDEIIRLFNACRKSKSPYLYFFVLMSLSTGARQGEILGLEWRHIDFDNQVAHLKETKNGRPVSISLADPVIDGFVSNMKGVIQERLLFLLARLLLDEST